MTLGDKGRSGSIEISSPNMLIDDIGTIIPLVTEDSSSGYRTILDEIIDNFPRLNTLLRNCIKNDYHTAVPLGERL